MIQITKNFKDVEFIPKNMYAERGQRSIRCMDRNIILCAQFIRDRFGRGMHINNYCYGGNREWSGIRTPESPYYSKWSMHTWGKAFDFIFSRDHSQDLADEVREDIRNNYELYRQFGVGGIETNISWIHIDTRFNPNNKVIELDYNKVAGANLAYDSDATNYLVEFNPN